MSNPFYKVTFVGSGEEYFFKDHESATTFLLESYFDEVEVDNEEQVIAINNEVADEDGIDGYGWLNECWFENF